MKKLLFVRHAKSDWSHDVSDFDRPLNERGHNDAPKMAKFLLDEGYEIQQFVTSPAKRALTTCRYFAETFGQSKIKKIEELYEPHPEDFLHTILNFDDEWSTVAIFSHNPSISEYVSLLTKEVIQLTTCNVVVIEFDSEHWSSFEGTDKKVVAHYRPKDLFDS